MDQILGVLGFVGATGLIGLGLDTFIRVWREQRAMAEQNLSIVYRFDEDAAESDPSPRQRTTSGMETPVV